MTRFVNAKAVIKSASCCCQVNIRQVYKYFVFYGIRELGVNKSMIVSDC